MSALPEPLPRPRLGFVGTGWIGRKRLESVAASGLADIVLVADPSPEAAAAAQRLAPEAARGASLDEALLAGLDAVVLATPSAQHAGQAVAALEAGIAVFCQKPLARDAAETERVVAAARAAGVLLGVDLSYRHLAGARRLRELARSGALGHIRAVDLVFHNAYGPDKPWFYERRLAGGGCLLDLGIHLVDLALDALDWPEVFSVSAGALCGDVPLRAKPGGVEDYATATLELAGGTLVNLACSWRLPAGCDCRIEAALWGSEGGARLFNVDGSFYDFAAERFAGTSREALGSEGGAWQEGAVLQFVRALAAGRRFDPEIERAVTVARALDAIYTAAGANGGNT